MKTLLLLHGALGSKVQFNELKSFLSKKYDVHVLNFAGHGGRSTEKVFSNEFFSKDIVEYLDENKIDHCDILGYSMGGYVALHFAKTNPAKIGKIMTLATKFNWTPETAAKEIKKLNPVTIEQKVPKFAAMLEARHAPNDWKIVLDKTADLMKGLGNGHALNENDFSGINNEILIAIGDADKMVSIEESKKVADILPNGKLLILEGVEHPIEQVDTQLLHDVIVKFID